MTSDVIAQVAEIYAIDRTKNVVTKTWSLISVCMRTSRHCQLPVKGS